MDFTASSPAESILNLSCFQRRSTVMNKGLALSSEEFPGRDASERKKRSLSEADCRASHFCSLPFSGQDLRLQAKSVPYKVTLLEQTSTYHFMFLKCLVWSYLVHVSTICIIVYDSTVLIYLCPSAIRESGRISALHAENLRHLVKDLRISCVLCLFSHEKCLETYRYWK